MQTITSFENPFVGLRPFDVSESLLFFGRGAQTGELLERLNTRRFVSVVGRSGCGKSSLIRAGLIPKLKAGFLVADRDRWVVATMKPGDRPLHNLAAAVLEAAGLDPEGADAAARAEELVEEVSAEGVTALAARLAPVLDHADANFLLLVDQFEEIFRFGARPRDDEEEAEHDPAVVRRRDEAADFVSLMLALSEQRDVPAYVVMTMRSDFLGDCDAFRGLPEAMNRSQYLVPRLSTQQREESISGPIRLCGGSITPRLLDLVRNDVGDKLDQLPVMQHAMMRTWENWRGGGDDDRRGPVDVPDYLAAGTIHNALSDDAEDVLRSLGGEDSPGRKLTMLVFQALTDTDADNRRVRRPKRLRELEAVTGADAGRIMEIVKLFEGGGRSFLTVAHDAARANHLVDISHESLIRQWKTLREWVDKEADWRATYLRIADAAVRRKTKGGGLWDDPDLQQALDWWAEREPTRAWAEQYHASRKKKSTKPGGDEEELDIYAEAKQFLEESRAARDRELQDKERQRRREKNLTRLVILVISAGLLLTSTLGAYAWAQKNEAVAQQNIAVEEAARARQFATEALAARSEAEERERSERNAKQNLEASEEARLKALEDAEAARDTAEENARKEEKARADAERQAGIARTNARKFRDALAQALVANERAESLIYTSDINVVEDSEEEGDTERSRQILTNHIPASLRTNAPAGPAANLWAGIDGAPAPPPAAPAAEAAPADAREQDRRDFSWYYFWRLNHRDARTLEVGPNPLSSVSYSADGKLIASSDFGGAVKLWDATTSREVRSLPRGEPVIAAALSPDGKKIVLGGEDGAVRLWDTESGEAPAELGSIAGPAELVAYSPDGKFIAAASSSLGWLSVWDAATKAPRPNIKTIIGGPIHAISFTPDNDRLIVAGSTGLRVWDLETDKAEGEKFATGVTITSLAFVGDDEALFALGDSRGGVTLYGGDEVKIGSFNAHGGPVKSLAFSPDGRTLATAAGETSAKLWDVRTQRKLVTLDNPRGYVSRVAFSPDGKTLATGGAEGAVKLWDAALLRGYVEPAMPEDLAGRAASSCVFSPDRRLLAVLSEDGSVVVWDTASYGQPIRRLKSPGAEGFSAVAFSPADGRLVAGDRAGRLHLFDTTSWAAEPLDLPSLADEVISALAFSPDGRLLAVAGGNSLVILDARTRRELKAEAGGRVRAPLAFSRAGDLLAAATEDATVALYDVAAGRVVGETAPKGGVNAVAFSPDGRTLAVGGDDKNVRLWDVAKVRGDARAPQRREGPRLLEGHKGEVVTLAFSPDGRTLATGGLDETARLWSTSTHRLLATLKGHASDVLSVSFAPDGRALATADSEGKVKVWRAASDEEVRAQQAADAAARP